MVQTLWDSITEFLAGGDQRTEALREGIRENVTPFVPPNLREPLGLLAEMNPVQDIYRAGGNMRGGNYVDAGIDTAIAAAPVVGGVLGRVGANQLADTGGDAARAAMDTLLGGAPGRSASAVDTFAERMNQRGPVPTMYSTGDWRFWEDPKLAQPYRKPNPERTQWTFGDVDASLNSRLSSAENRRIDADTSRIEEVPIRKLNAMQDSVGVDFATTTSSSGELPLVVRKDGKMFVRDGHHRLTKASEEGSQTAKVRFIDLDGRDTDAPLLDYDADAARWTSGDDALLEELTGGPQPSADLTPAPRNEAEAVAREILDMRAAGRAGDVTDEMMAQADPQYMFANTPLPMDEASRMARAREDAFTTGRDRQDVMRELRGLDNPQLVHYTNQDFTEFRIPERQNRQAIWATPDPSVNLATKDNFQDFSDEGVVGIPVMGRMTKRVSPYEFRMAGDPMTPGFPRNVTAEDVAKANSVGADYAAAGLEYAIFDPANIRSRFARFDPEFRHLRNLSAGVAGGGLLATQDDQQQLEDDIRQYLGGLL